MPKTKIVIEFFTNTDGSLTHQVQNLGEDLWREIEREELGDVGGIEAIDRATDRIVVNISHSRKIGDVRKLVTKQIKRHLLQDRCRVTFE